MSILKAIWNLSNGYCFLSRGFPEILPGLLAFIAVTMVVVHRFVGCMDAWLSGYESVWIKKLHGKSFK